MYPSVSPALQVTIGDAASFVGCTPRAIRHYHDMGLLPEPVRGSDNRRRYGYQEMIRLLWIRKMAGAGIALSDIRDALVGTASTGADGDLDVVDVLERLDESLVARESELLRQRTAVQRMRSRGSRMGLLSDFVINRLESLSVGSLRQADLDSLLVTERIFGPLGAAVQATRFLALIADPALRAESDRVDAAEAALDDTVAVDDPRVAQVAARRHAFERALHHAIENSVLSQSEEALFDSWDALQQADAAASNAEADQGSRRRQGSGSVLETAARMPYDFSPARIRCLELADEIAARESAFPCPSGQAGPTVSRAPA